MKQKVLVSSLSAPISSGVIFTSTTYEEAEDPRHKPFDKVLVYLNAPISNLIQFNNFTYLFTTT